MQMTELLELEGTQFVKLPEDYRFSGQSVSIRKAGDAVILEPLPGNDAWPEGFFEQIRIDDPAFVRPDQGRSPSAPLLS